MNPGPKFISYGNLSEVKFSAKDASSKTAKKFLSDRFKVFFPDQRQATLIGSTSLYMPKDKYNPYLARDLNKCRRGKHTVCDSFSFTSPQFSEDCTLITLRAAVTDGLGYDEDDNQFNLSVATVANKAAEYWTQQRFGPNLSAVEMRRELAVIATEVNQSLPPILKSHAPTCSLASVILQSCDDSWQGQFVNIGDSMIAIVDGSTLQVKDIIGAKVKHRSRGNYSPESLQEILQDSDVPACVQERKISLADDDFIILMTDGVYSGLELETRASDETEISWQKEYAIYKDTKVKPKALEKAIEHLRGNTSINAMDIAHAILSKQTQKFLSDNQEAHELLIRLYRDIKRNARIKDMTLDEYLEHNRLHDPDFCSRITEFLRTSGQHDGFEFETSIARVHDLQQVLGTQEYGDCTTISVIQVPNFEEALIKQYLVTKEDMYLDALLTRVSPMKAKELLSKIPSCQHIPYEKHPDGLLLGSLKKPSAQFDIKQIEKLDDTLTKLALRKSKKDVEDLSDKMVELHLGQGDAPKSSKLPAQKLVENRSLNHDKSGDSSNSLTSSKKPVI